MNQGEIIKARLNYNRRWLDSVLPRLTQEIMEWAPAEGMRTIAGQLVEIIEVEAQLVPVARDGQTLSDDQLATLIGDPKSLERLKTVLTEVRAQTLAHLETLSGEDLAQEVTLPQWYGAFWPKPCPLGEHFRNVAEHEFYHTAQLISYLWAHGDNPYDW